MHARSTGSGLIHEENVLLDVRREPQEVQDLLHPRLREAREASEFAQARMNAANPAMNQGG